MERDELPYLKNLEGYQQSASRVFSTLIVPGGTATESGIYHCEACGFEVACVSGAALPREQSCSNHEKRWKCRQGSVRWRLVAAPINTNG